MSKISFLERAAQAASVAAQFCDDVDQKARFPHEAFRALKEAGLMGILVPRDLGGEGASLEEVAELCCYLGQHCSATAMIYAMHQIKASSLVSHGCESEWHREFMRRVVREQLLLGSATTEGGIGGDLRNSICAVERRGDRFHLRKDATVISYGRESDAILVTCRAAPESPSSDQVMVVVTKDQYTLEHTTGWNTLGMRGTCSDGFILDANGRVEQIFPQPFAEIAAQSMLAHAHILWSSLWYGIAANAVSRAQAFVRAEARKSNNGPSPGALRVAEAANLLQLMKAGITTALQRYETARQDEDKLSSMGFSIDMNNLKIGSSRLVVEIVQSAMMVCGIMGYKNNTPYSLGRHMRDALSAPIMINNDRIYANTSNLLLVHRLDQRLAG